MKRIILISCYILATIAMASCTNDEVETPQNNIKLQTSADEPIDGQNGQIPISPPKP